nr:MAG TPA: hypothetical protein [Bacteriophage sp.]
MTNRNLDGCYFRIRRGEKYENLCFSDLTRNEQEELLKDKSPEYIQELAIRLAETLRQIGDQFDLIGGFND